jgi:hypothetical protein
MGRTFKFTLRVKGCKKAPKEDRPMFVKALMDQADDILNECVEVTFEELSE